MCIDTIAHNNPMFEPFMISNWFEITKIILMLNSGDYKTGLDSLQAVLDLKYANSQGDK